MAKIDELEKGDRVSWKTPQGRTQGKVVAIRTKDFSIEGTDLTASKDEPMVEVESEKTGAHAGHKASALSKLKEKDGKKDAKAKDSKKKDTKAKAKDGKAKGSSKKTASKKKG